MVKLASVIRAVFVTRPRISGKAKAYNLIPFAGSVSVRVFSKAVLTNAVA